MDRTEWGHGARRTECAICLLAPLKSYNCTMYLVQLSASAAPRLKVWRTMPVWLDCGFRYHYCRKSSTESAPPAATMVLYHSTATSQARQNSLPVSVFTLSNYNRFLYDNQHDLPVSELILWELSLCAPFRSDCAPGWSFCHLHLNSRSRRITTHLRQLETRT